MSSNEDSPLKLVSKSQATTYIFESRGNCRWACATVNDHTAELNIQSDFGNWSYRWGCKAFGGKREGHNYNLTGFIGERGSGQYLADKLCPNSDVFNVDKTIAAWQKLVCDARLQSGREFIDYYREEDPEDVPSDWDIDMKNEPRYLTKAVARSMWNALAGLNQYGYRSPELLIDRYYSSDCYEYFARWLTEEPWNHLEYEDDYAYVVLRYQIIPALIDACREVSDTDNP